MSDVRLNDAWVAFCQQLAEAGSVLMRPEAPGGELDQAEGLRYLTRLTRVALESVVESSDVDFPRLFAMSSDTVKIGADNPDNIYWNAAIAGDRDYRIWGNRGSVPYLSFGTKANRFAIDGGMASTGELDDTAMHFEPDGSFEIIVSRTQKGRNWLPLTDDSTMLLVRQTFLDKSVEKPATIHIECLDGPTQPQPLTAETIQSQLSRSAAFVRTTASTFAGWATMFMARPNELLPWDQSIFQKVGGDPNITYLHGYWRLGPDEAWVIETEVPDCRFWNFVLQNWWMESADYRHIDNAWVNKRMARLEPDGRLVIVAAARDPGFGNWIDITGHSSGTALLRWISADSAPVPRCKVISIAREVEAGAPA